MLGQLSKYQLVHCSPFCINVVSIISSLFSSSKILLSLSLIRSLLNITFFELLKNLCNETSTLFSLVNAIRFNNCWAEFRSSLWLSSTSPCSFFLQNSTLPIAKLSITLFHPVFIRIYKFTPVANNKCFNYIRLNIFALTSALLMFMTSSLFGYFLDI